MIFRTGANLHVTAFTSAGKMTITKAFRCELRV